MRLLHKKGCCVDYTHTYVLLGWDRRFARGLILMLHGELNGVKWYDKKCARKGRVAALGNCDLCKGGARLLLLHVTKKTSPTEVAKQRMRQAQDLH